jgi:hypothetical protein
MRNLTAAICLAVALLMGSTGISWGADFQKGLKAYHSGDYATALREWTPLAEQGYAGTQFSLGILYEKGWGVPQDYKAAVRWWRLAAEQGDLSAQYALGRLYDEGQRPPGDFKTTAECATLALQAPFAERLAVCENCGDAGDRQSDAGEAACEGAGRQQFLGDGETGDQRHPEHVHHAGSEQQQHQNPAAAETEGAVPGTHAKCACQTGPPVEHEKLQWRAAFFQAGLLDRQPLIDAGGDK